MAATVLIADDDDEVRELTTILLEQAGYCVLTARDGQEALALIEETPVDAVLLDMMMPEVDGLELLDRLLRGPPRQRPVVIAHSGFDRLKELALTHGAAAFLAKPVEPRQLLDVVGQLVETRTLAPDLGEAHEQAHRQAMAAADETRERILHHAHIDAAEIRGQARRLVAWLTGYFPAETAFVALVHCGRIFVYALAGTDAVREDACLALDASYCPDVARAAEPLIVSATGNDTLFAGHPAAAGDLPFYAGAPLLADGVSLGTVCVRSARPFLVHAEDLALLGHFGRLIGCSFRDPSGCPLDLFADDDVLAPMHLAFLVERALYRAERDDATLAIAIAETERPERSGRAMARRAGSQDLALVSLGANLIAVVAEGGATGPAGERAAAALSAIDAGGPVRAAITQFEPARQSVDPGEVIRAALRAPRLGFSTGATEERAPP